MRSGLFIPLFDELADPALVLRLSAQAEEAGWHGVFVWDNLRYVEPAQAAGFRTIAYLVEVGVDEALARNAQRAGRRRVPTAGLVGTDRRLVRPTPEEGFDELWHATGASGGGWRIEPLLVTPPLF